MGIDLVVGEGSISYGPKGRHPSPGNTNEYEKLLYVIGLIRDQVHDRGLKVIGINCLEQKLFGKKSNFIMKERIEIEGFPDMAIVSDQYVVCIDHFSVDASEIIYKNGKSHGSKYAQILGEHGPHISDEDLSSLVKRINSDGIVFTRESLVTNLHDSLAKKTEKIPRYIEAAREHIATKEKSVAEADLNKDFEVWFLVEHNSPLIPELGFPLTDPRLHQFLTQNRQIGGIIYFDNPNPAAIIDTLDAVIVVVNDETATRILRKWPPGSNEDGY